MTVIRGSQIRERIEDTEYKLIGRIDSNSVCLADHDGKIELWTANDDHSGYTVEIEGVGYEFVRDALPGDKWWAGMKAFN